MNRLLKQRKNVMLKQLKKKFNHESCMAEPPQYQKMRANKLAEIETLKKMLKILNNLGWKSPVFNAISRISVGGVDENPEPGYKLTHRMNVANGLSNYRFDMQQRVGEFARIAIKLQIGTSWVWASFDASTSNFKQYLIPDAEKNPSVTQSYVRNLVVKKSVSITNVITTTDKPSAKGNLEIWSDATRPKNFLEIPGAVDGLFDFGDQRHMTRDTSAPAGSFQVHDFLNKQTVLAINNFKAKGNHDVGIGNQKGHSNPDLSNPDWTNAKNSGKLTKAGHDIVISWYIQPSATSTTKQVKQDAPPSTNTKTTKGTKGTKGL